MYSNNLEMYRALGVECPKKAGKDTLFSAGVGKGFVRAISSVLGEDQLERIQNSSYYSLIFDASGM